MVPVKRLSELFHLQLLPILGCKLSYSLKQSSRERVLISRLSSSSSTECLGIHLGAPQSANLGDGNGPVNQTVELRYDFGDAELGTCLESLVGGNHLRFVFIEIKSHLKNKRKADSTVTGSSRMFRQNGTEANSGALFLAYVAEK